MPNRNEATETDSDYIPPREAARIAFVSTKTLQNLAKAGRIGFITLPSGHRRYKRVDVAALISDRVEASESAA